MREHMMTWIPTDVVLPPTGAPFWATGRNWNTPVRAPSTPPGGEAVTAAEYECCHGVPLGQRCRKDCPSNRVRRVMADLAAVRTGEQHEH